jgi:hypothetical protein
MLGLEAMERRRLSDKKFVTSEKERLHKQEYYQKNKEIIKAKVHNYAQQHKEKIKEYNQLYNIKNRIVISERNKIYAQTHAVQIRAMKRLYEKKNRSKINDYCRRNYYRIRLLAISHYSKGLNRCDCCGETEIRFLTFDHIDGGGSRHKKSTSLNLVAWLYKNKFPDGFQVLCFNCNCGRGFNSGICPHKLLVAPPELETGTEHHETVKEIVMG